MKNSSPDRIVPFLTQLLLWALVSFFLLFWQPLTWRIPLPQQFWMKQFLQLALLVTLFYLNHYNWVPRLLLKEKVLTFVIINVIAVFLIAFMVQRFEVLINIREHMDKAFKTAKETGAFVRREEFVDFFTLIMAAMMAGLSTSIAAVQNWQKNNELRLDLEKEKMTSELSFLKAQINPHFFFNTLNNIYALTVVDVDASRESIHKLSRMMRYLLYETHNDLVMISQEISFIGDYIELMKLRLTNKVEIIFNPPDTKADIQVAPMIFLPFVENAFKHGISATERSHINISLSHQNDTITFIIRNTFFTEKVKGKDETPGSGIGLVNTQRRLDLLYPGRYTLDISNIPGEDFIVELKIDTNT